MANRLAHSTSPYLLQHQDNPVDWQEWGPRGVRRGARARRPRPPLGGVCRVPLVPRHGSRVVRGRGRGTGAQRGLRRGQGGPRGTPRHRRGLHGGHDRPHGARRLADDRASSPPTATRSSPAPTSPRVSSSASRRGHRRLDHPARPGPRQRRPHRLAAARALRPRDRPRLGRGRARAAAVQLRGQFDHAAAGFGGAPKFPPSMVLEFLLRHHARTGSADALAMAASTCEAMARGGLYDQLGGGFARYSVDARWVVPHFEKMLYDNAQLLRVYTHLHRRHRRPARPPGGPGDGRVPAARPAHRRGRPRLGAGRGHRRCRGPDLCVDAGPARRGARRGGRRSGGHAAHRHDGGHLRARLVHAPAAGRPGRRRVVGRRATTAARRATNATAARPRRQGRHLLERPGHRRARRRRDAARAARPRRGGPGVRRVRRLDPPRRRPPPPHLACRRRSAPQPAWPTTTATSPRDFSPSTRPPATRNGLRLHRICSPRRSSGSRAEDGGFHDTSDDAEALFTRPRSAADNAEPSGPVRPGRRPAHLLGPHRGPGDARACRRSPRGIRAARRPRPALRRLGAGGRRGLGHRSAAGGCRRHRPRRRRARRRRRAGPPHPGW